MEVLSAVLIKIAGAPLDGWVKEPSSSFFIFFFSLFYLEENLLAKHERTRARPTSAAPADGQMA